MQTNWKPLAEVPADRLDGREVLLWKGALIVATWLGEWLDAVGRPVVGATHYADAEGPSHG